MANFTKRLFFGMTLVISLLSFVNIAHATSYNAEGNGGAVSVPTCGYLTTAGTYTLDNTGSAFSGSGDCLHVTSPNVIIDGGSISLVGNIVADAVDTNTDGFSFSLQNITVTGSVSSAGLGSGGVGTVTFENTAVNSGSISGNVVFNGGAESNSGSITGNATFNQDATNAHNGTISGTATFANTDYYSDPTGGNLVGANVYFSTNVSFHLTNYNWGMDNTDWHFGGTASWEFLDTTKNTGKIVVPTNGGLVSFSGAGSYCYNAGTIIGQTSFNGASYNDTPGQITGLVDFYYASYNLGTITGATTFNSDVNGNNAHNSGTINGDVTFNGYSYNNKSAQNPGIINGSATFTANSYDYNGIDPTGTSGKISGTITFANDVVFNLGAFDWSSDSSTWVFNGKASWVFTSGSKNEGTIRTAGGGAVTFGDTSYNHGTVYSDAIAFSGSAYNKSGGSIHGNPTFIGSSYNAGSITTTNGDHVTFSGNSYNGVTGTITGNAEVYSPSSKPIGNRAGITGTVIYHDFPAFYFNDQTTSVHILNYSNDGDWGNRNNWYTDANFTNQSSSVPTGIDDVFFYSNLTQNSLSQNISASAQSAVFNNSSQNGITLTTTSGTTFNNTSANVGTVYGGAIFNGDNSTTINGNVTGSTATRQYTSNIAITRDFSAEGGRNDWIVVARGATVDISGSTYTSANTFKTFDGSFAVASGHANVTPNMVVSSPVVGINTKWLPSVNWDSANVCQYSYDNFVTTHTLDCSKNGSDISRPSAGSNILSLRATKSSSPVGIAEKTVSFTYDNTSPTYTLCGTDFLDEARTYYYLQGNVTGDCTITYTGGTELRGAGFTVSGNVKDNSAINGLVLKNITVTGYASSSGATITIQDSTTGNIISSGGTINIATSTVGTVSANGKNGSNGGDITIATSTTSTVSANGGNTSTSHANGGDGGTINITYSVATVANTTVYSTGGNSTVCGNGGNGGTVNITNSLNYIISNAGGTGHSCQGSGGSSGSGGSGYVRGTYVPPSSTNLTNSNPAPASYSGGGGGGGPSNPYIFGVTKAPLILPVAVVKPLALKKLPTLVSGTTTKKDQFSLEPIVGDFILAPIPTIVESLKDAKQLNKYLSSVGLSTQQDLLATRKKPIVLTIPKKKADIPDGLILLSSNGSPVTLYASYDNERVMVEKATITASSTLIISLFPYPSNLKGPIKATFNGQTLTFKKGIGTSMLSTSFVSPKVATTTSYELIAKGAPLSLIITVVPLPPLKPIEKVKNQNVWGVLKLW